MSLMPADLNVDRSAGYDGYPPRLPSSLPEPVDKLATFFCSDSLIDFLSRLFYAEIPPKMKINRVGYHSGPVGNWLEDFLRFLQDQKENFKLPLTSSEAFALVHEAFLDKDLPPPPLSGKIISDMLYALNVIFSFCEYPPGISITADDRSRAVLTSIDWNEVSKYLKAIERLGNMNYHPAAKDSRFISQANTDSAQGITVRRIVPDEYASTKEYGDETEVQLDDDPFECDPVEVARSEINAARFLATELSGAPSSDVLTSPTHEAGGYTDMIDGQVKSYSHGLINYHDLIILRLVKFLETFNLDDDVQLPCVHITTEKCMEINKGGPCPYRAHFYKLVTEATDESLGDCTFLNGCYNLPVCPYIHYRTLQPSERTTFYQRMNLPLEVTELVMDKGNGDFRAGVDLIQKAVRRAKPPAQWINARIQDFDLRILGTFTALLIDRHPVDYPYEVALQADVRRRCS
ncbi:hypothetical protein FN846DRAFT_990048 [Sphaerosporella brunnea]|uniref:Uncharacterized protein n=1 Tax=Sphaerosporella brunnea TaxID=1250544 RepID=A0A5J5EQ15_9PEZI|nr:hypothetical protein FN846DRAFT_990048 [Sphaerosporella brunnea]